MGSVPGRKKKKKRGKKLSKYPISVFCVLFTTRLHVRLCHGVSPSNNTHKKLSKYCIPVLCLRHVRTYNLVMRSVPEQSCHYMYYMSVLCLRHVRTYNLVMRSVPEQSCHYMYYMSVLCLRHVRTYNLVMRSVPEQSCHYMSVLCLRHVRTHTPSIAFRHLSPNSARFTDATEGALFISAVSALRKVRVLINYDCRSNLAPKHARKHETHAPRVKKKKKVLSRFIRDCGFICAGVNFVGGYK